MTRRSPHSEARPFRPGPRDHAASLPPLDPADGPEALVGFARDLVIGVAATHGVPRRMIGLAFGIGESAIAGAIRRSEQRAAAAGCDRGGFMQGAAGLSP